MILLLCLLLCSSFTSGLRLEFNPTNELLRLSSRPNLNLYDLIKTSFLSRPFWPLLSALSRARYYNFNEVFISTIKHLPCNLVLDVIQSEAFPVSEVLNGSVLGHPDLTGCLFQLPTNFFKEKVWSNPLESLRYVPTKIGPVHHIFFMKMAYERASVNTNWYAWCSDSNLSDENVSEIPRPWEVWAWKTLSAHCIAALPDPVASEMLNVLTPVAELNAFIVANTSNLTVLERFSVLLQSIVYNPTAIEIIFAINQIMRVITLSTYIFIYPITHVLHNTAKTVLNDYLNIVKANRTVIFPMRRELKQYIRNILKIHIDGSSVVINLLLQLAAFCRGRARGPWFMNLLVIWNAFNADTDTRSITYFLDKFTRLFFDPLTEITAPDTCVLLRSINAIFSVPLDDFYFAERLFDQHLARRLTLARAVFRHCFDELPKSKSSNIQLFPLDFRLEQLFHQTRYIENWVPHQFATLLKKTPEKLLISVFIQITGILDDQPDLTDYSSILPLNSQIITERTVFKGHLPGLLKLFFQSVIFSLNWFTRYIKRSDPRVSLLPSLKFPPQFMEIVGFMLGKAVICNQPVPFTLNRKYFELSDTLTSINEPNQRITSVLKELYPSALANRVDFQIYNVIEWLDLSITGVIQKLNLDDVLNGPLNESEFIINHPYDMDRIVLMGSERLRIGLKRALPADLFSSRQLYDLIFR